MAHVDIDYAMNCDVAMVPRDVDTGSDFDGDDEGVVHQNLSDIVDDGSHFVLLADSCVGLMICIVLDSIGAGGTVVENGAVVANCCASIVKKMTIADAHSNSASFVDSMRTLTTNSFVVYGFWPDQE